MTSLLGRLLAVGGLIGASLTTLTVSTMAPAHAASGWCADGKAAPCIVSATRDGVNLKDSATYSVGVVTFADPSDARHETGFDVFGLTSVDIGHSFVVTMDTGSIEPRLTEGWARNGSRTKWKDTGTGHWMQTTTVQPAHMIINCQPAPGDTFNCPSPAPLADEQFQISINIQDGVPFFVSEPKRAPEVDGLESYSDIQLFWFPPTITTTPAGVVTVAFEMTNAHAWHDGTAFTGSADLRIPNHVLKTLYDIPNPETMTDGSFVASTTSGTATSTQEPGGDAWRISLSGVTFSKQLLKLKRGRITPAATTITKATRVSRSGARLVFPPAQPRGAKVTGYDAQCTSASGPTRTATKSGAKGPISVTGLRAGTSYKCKVRGKSKVGKGAWSRAFKVHTHR